MNSQVEFDAITFRALLKTRPNPITRLDYLTSLKKTVTTTLMVSLTYVPDKLLLRPESFDTYLEVSAPRILEPYELYAHSFAEDVNNEVVPRWLRIEIIMENASTRRIVVTDNQPKWSNPALLASTLYAIPI